LLQSHENLFPCPPALTIFTNMFGTTLYQVIISKFTS